jgi:hypothetical protein
LLEKDCKSAKFQTCVNYMKVPLVQNPLPPFVNIDGRSLKCRSEGATFAALLSLHDFRCMTSLRYYARGPANKQVDGFKVKSIGRNYKCMGITCKTLVVWAPDGYVAYANPCGRGAAGAAVRCPG